MVELSLEQVIPHQPPMRLIDRIIHVDHEQAVCEASMTADHLFYDGDINGIYAWIGLELMAQTAAVFSYKKAEHQTQKIAYLMSIRQLNTTVSYFPIDSVLTVIATNVAFEQGIAVFDCCIQIHQEIVTTAKLSVYQPEAECR